MLVSAAAKRWNVDSTSCRAQRGEVLHLPSGGRAQYGDLAADAALLPVPEKVGLKEPRDFTLVGTRAKRVDTQAKVNGTAVFGIDVRPPGVKIATLAQSPVFGGRVKSVDDKAALAVNGVRQVVRLDDAVAVIADHMGAAKKGLAALVIEWDDGPHAKLTTNDIAAELEQATLKSGPLAQNIGDVEKAMAGAATKVEAIYQAPFLAHATMEPMNCTVRSLLDRSRPLRRHCQNLRRRPLCLRLRPFKLTDFSIQPNPTLENVVEHSQIDKWVSRPSSALNPAPVSYGHSRDGGATGASPRRTSGRSDRPRRRGRSRRLRRRSFRACGDA
jgi:hypothetical protein